VNEEHDDLRALVAEYGSARMTPEERRTVEEHVARCASCAELAGDVKLLRQQIREGGEAMFEPHPEPAALREYARGADEPDTRLGRHLRICSVCRLEVEAWRARRATTPSSLRSQPGPTAWWTRIGVAASAAAIVGLAAGWRFHAAVSRSIAGPAPSSGAPAVQGTPPPGPGIALAVQAPVLHLLPGLVRAGELPGQRWILDAGETSIGVAVPIMVPSTAAGTDRFRFELRRADGDLAWSQEMTAERIRAHMEAADVVNLIVAPEKALEAGDYEFRVVPAAAAAPIYRARLEMAYRQSPAATKAPQ
jgi:hypothetical protein